MTNDRDAIADLVAELGDRLDTGRFGDGSAIYTEDAIVHSPRGIARGLAEISERASRNAVEHERTQHLHTDVRIVVDGDRAEARTNQLVYFFRDGERPHRSAGLRCDYTAARTGAGWRLTRATIAPRWISRD